MMAEDAAAAEQCATCAKVAGNGIRLRACTACETVSYCSVACQRSHWRVHKKKCETIQRDRAFEAAVMEAPLSEEEVVMPPPKPECSLCSYTLPPNTIQSVYMPCCAQVICRACFVRTSGPEFFASPDKMSFASGGALSNFSPGKYEKRCASMKCPYCRSATLTLTKKACREKGELLERQARRNDPRAMYEVGSRFTNGEPASHEEIHRDIMENKYDSNKRVGKDEKKGLEWYKKAADLGSCDACYELAKYHKKNRKASDYLIMLEKASQLGSLEAHSEMADIAMKKQNKKKAMAHHKILACTGHSFDSKNQLIEGYRQGDITKEDLEVALRAYQSAREEFASRDRCRMAMFLAGMSNDGKVIPNSQFV